MFSSERLIERGVLVGPSLAFLDVIGQVLPSLGETQVVATTIERLLPGVVAEGGEDFEAAAVKGRAVCADVLRRVVADRWPVPVALELPYGGDLFTLGRGQVDEVLQSARTGGRSYAETGAVVRRRLADQLARTVVTRNQQLLDEAEMGFERILGAADRDLSHNDRLGPGGAARGIDVDGVATNDEVDDLYAGGQVAVIAPAARHDLLRPLVNAGGARLLTPSGSKGLEFDAVLVVDPHAIVAPPRGWNALYVAMTRCTQELGLIALALGPADLDWG